MKLHAVNGCQRLNAIDVTDTAAKEEAIRALFGEVLGLVLQQQHIAAMVRNQKVMGSSPVTTTIDNSEYSFQKWILTFLFLSGRLVTCFFMPT